METRRFPDAFAHVLDLGDEHGLKPCSRHHCAAHALATSSAAPKSMVGWNPCCVKPLSLSMDDTEQRALQSYWPLAGLRRRGLSAYLDLAQSDAGGAKVGRCSCYLEAAIAQTDPAERARLLEKCISDPGGQAQGRFLALHQEDAQCTAGAGSGCGSRTRSCVFCRERLVRVRMLKGKPCLAETAERLDEDYEELKRRRQPAGFRGSHKPHGRASFAGRRGSLGSLQAGSRHRPHSGGRSTGYQPCAVEHHSVSGGDFFAGESARPGKRTLFFGGG